MLHIPRSGRRSGGQARQRAQLQEHRSCGVGAPGGGATARLRPARSSVLQDAKVACASRHGRTYRTIGRTVEGASRLLSSFAAGSSSAPLRKAAPNVGVATHRSYTQAYFAAASRGLYRLPRSRGRAHPPILTMLAARSCLAAPHAVCNRVQSSALPSGLWAGPGSRAAGVVASPACTGARPCASGARSIMVGPRRLQRLAGRAAESASVRHARFKRGALRVRVRAATLLCHLRRPQQQQWHAARPQGFVAPR